MIYDYPKVDGPSDLLPFCVAVKRERTTDLDDYNNLPKRFVKGRKVDKIPVSSTDVTPEDRLGDINYDASFLYILVYDGNNNVWRRSALGAF